MCNIMFAHITNATPGRKFALLFDWHAFKIFEWFRYSALGHTKLISCFWSYKSLKNNQATRIFLLFSFLLFSFLLFSFVFFCFLLFSFLLFSCLLFSFLFFSFLIFCFLLFSYLLFCLLLFSFLFFSFLFFSFLFFSETKVERKWFTNNKMHCGGWSLGTRIQNADKCVPKELGWWSHLVQVV